MKSPEAKDVIKDYEDSRKKEILIEIERLKPNPFSGLLSLMVILLIALGLSIFTEIQIFEGEFFLYFMIVLVVSSSIERESRKINKRIDLLLRLVKSD